MSVDKGISHEAYEAAKMNQGRRLKYKYGSYGKDNLITMQSKVCRVLFGKYDVVRRMMNQTRREGLEDFMRWSIDEYRNKVDSEGLNEFLDGKEEV